MGERVKQVLVLLLNQHQLPPVECDMMGELTAALTEQVPARFMASA